MLKTLALAVLLLGTLAALAPLDVSAAPNQPGSVTACNFIGFAAQTEFLRNAAWRALEFENRISLTNEVTVDGRYTHPRELNGMGSTAWISLGGLKGSELDFTSLHSGTAIYACGRTGRPPSSSSAVA